MPYTVYNIPIYQLLIMLVIGLVLFFVFSIFDSYVFAIDKREQEQQKLFWKRSQIVIWIVYALLLFSLFFVSNQLFTIIITAIIIGLGWQYWSNIFAGILIKLTNELKLGDHIKTSFVAGEIIEINIAHSILQNEKGALIVIPNTKLKHAVRIHQSAKNNNSIHTFRLKSDIITFDEVLTMTMNCPYIIDNDNINVTRTKKNVFQIKANLIDDSFIDLTAIYFKNK